MKERAAQTEETNKVERLFLHLKHHFPAKQVIEEDAVLGNAGERDLLSVLLDPALHDWVRPSLFHHAYEFDYINIQKVIRGPPLGTKCEHFQKKVSWGPPLVTKCAVGSK